MPKVQRGSSGKVTLPIPTKDGGLPDDAQLHHECNGSHDQATHQALYLDASQHRLDVSLSADLPGFVQGSLESLMWGGEASTRRLRESIAVAISASNQCFY
jgi:hypothetical protein